MIRKVVLWSKEMLVKVYWIWSKTSFFMKNLIWVLK